MTLRITIALLAGIILATLAAAILALAASTGDDRPHPAPTVRLLEA